MESRYQKTCAGCGEQWWTSPSTLPLCPTCWHTLDMPTKMWWWATKKTQRTLERLLDEWFEGGYEVEPDYNQVRKGPRHNPRGI
jgi:hypothetical protein